jgi:hypothetical protein
MNLIAKFRGESVSEVFTRINKLYTKFNEEILHYVEPSLTMEDKVIHYYNEEHDESLYPLLSERVIEYCLERGWNWCKCYCISCSQRK